LSVLEWQCLGRRLPNVATLTQEVAAWEQQRNQARVTIDWRFTTADARIKLKRLYSVLKDRLHSFLSDLVSETVYKGPAAAKRRTIRQLLNA
jgi:hypothetical protein